MLSLVLDCIIHGCSTCVNGCITLGRGPTVLDLDCVLGAAAELAHSWIVLWKTWWTGNRGRVANGILSFLAVALGMNMQVLHRCLEH